MHYRASKNFRGFSIPITMLVVLIMGLVGVAGWHALRVKDTSPNKHQQKSYGASDGTTPSEDPSESGTYLVIKEWGLRFPMPEHETQETVLYDLAENPAVDPKITLRTVRFSSKRFTEAAEPVCRFTTQQWGGVTGGLDTHLSGSKDQNVDHGSSYKFIGKIDNYYYWYESKEDKPGINCATNTALQEAVEQLENSYFKSLSKLEKIK